MIKLFHKFKPQFTRHSGAQVYLALHWQHTLFWCYSYAIRWQWCNRDVPWAASRGLTLEGPPFKGGTVGLLWQYRDGRWHFIGTSKARQKMGQRYGFNWV